MRHSLLRHFLLVFVLLLSARLGWSQGSTTAAMNGLISDKTGAALPGATVLATHTPTGTNYGVSTNADGRFNIQGMRVGGPYTVKITFVGYQDIVRDNVYLTLGQNLRLDVGLTEATTELSGVTVTGRRDPVINAGRTGAATTVTREQIQNLPTISRSLQDFTRLTPQSSSPPGGGTSVGGGNNRYNNITIDGAVNNDVFGLAGSGTPGGQAGTQPIALDALQEIQVVVAPYDVKLGNFTGGGINAVTRSGTNDLSASIYGFGTNQSIVGKSVTEPRVKADEFSNYQAGFRIGGAVVKNKLFFFANAELSRRSEPLQFSPGSSSSLFRQSEVDSVARFAQTLGYDAGSTNEVIRRTESNKIFGRLDWNINDKNQLTLRHNYVQAFDDNITRSSNLFRFGNNAYEFNNTTNSTVLQLISRFGRVSNDLILGYSRINDKRSTPGELFPQANFTQSGRQYQIGTERSSAANSLDQDIFELTDNVTATFGKHTVTLGTHNEFFRFDNLFVNNFNGRFDFGSLYAPTTGANTSFYGNILPNGNTVPGLAAGPRPQRVRASYSLLPDGTLPRAEFNAIQLGFYAQDEYTPVENLRLTLGARIDIPVFPDKPGNNPGVAETFGSDISTSNVPNGQVLFAPRLGFNWNPDKENSRVQLRGGSGIFNGRTPFVWVSNSFINNGLQLGTIDVRPSTAIPVLPFETDPSQFATAYSTGLVKTTEINVMRKDFKLPQVWRTNIATDFRVPGDVLITLEGIYTKTLNDVLYKDINLTAPTGRLAGPDQRVVYAATTAARRVDPDYTNVLLLENTSKGYRYTLTGQAQKLFDFGLNASVAYTYGVARDLNSGLSSTALSNWEFNQVYGSPNDPTLSYSAFDVRHRIIATGGYTFRYANKRLATTISAVYEGQSGTPFTYLYGLGGSDLNNDGAFSNDLFYIPRNQSEILLAPGSGDTRTVDQIWTDLNNFIESDDYLKANRGNYAERNGARTPFTHKVDVRLAQDINFEAGGKTNSLQITLDVINFGNLLNNDWGRQYFVNNQSFQLARVERFQNGQPVISFPKVQQAYDVSAFASRWQMQLGVRYSFN
ncbi:TonB-dependent receptor [Hymenobacter sp. ASUV-10]|uniref:TonB-dependent receptor n=1 Tax=Hymenobacter aranciens TaxID=3063996 RepID=A0ABT9BBP7_9BACT|nr:TonB-dependent receptor [Hymenobacter sp. ASUV-10]MDO7874136.1 TonB-dependent receptor [Hymenobacter sp. ASUV-10]